MRQARRAELIEQWRQEERAPFSGWDFSHIEERSIMAAPPWSFEDLARDALRTARRAVDLGTGGGERLSRVIGSAGGRIFATEGHAPNVPIAQARLSPFGVRLVACVSSRLALRDASFDLVLNSKTGLYASEVARVLTPGGRLLSEHIGPGVSREVRESRGLPPAPLTDRAAELAARCEEGGLAVEHVESAVLDHTFTDVGAIVYFLHAVPWAVRGFSVDGYVEPLLSLQERIEREGKLTFTRRMCLLIARRPA